MQWCAPDELAQQAGARLAPLLTHAARNVPRYRELFAELGAQPDELRTPADLRHLPISTKADLRAGFPERVLAANLPARRRVLRATSGSTGLPFEFFADRTGADLVLGSYLLCREWAGAPLGTALLYVASPAHTAANLASSSRLHRWLRRLAWGDRAIHLAGLDLSTAAFLAALQRIPTGRPYLLWGFPSYLGRLSGLLEEAGGSPPRPPVALVTYAETLTADVRLRLERTFGRPVVNHYSSWELPHLAQSCPDEPQLLHVISARAILRVVRPDGQDARTGESGRIVVTDLANWVMPLLNYDLGDWATVGPACRCGRGFPTLAAVEGRSSEVLHAPDGRVVSPVTLGRLVTFVCRALPDVWEYQAVQPDDVTVLLRLVPTAAYRPAAGERLRTALAELLGPEVAVHLELAARIAPEPSGKRLIVKSALARR